MNVNLTDGIIKDANALFDWHTKTELPTGSILGKTKIPGKREGLQQIPDYRIVKLNELISLEGKSVLELGCLEGIHTVGLLGFTNNVTAIDCRISNVVKTLTRVSLYGKRAGVFCYNADDLTKDTYGSYDVIFNCGVLYHLSNPVQAIFNLSHMCKHMLLDTHVTMDKSESTIFNDKKYSGIKYKEVTSSIFAGKDSFAFWLHIDELHRACAEVGFAVHPIEVRHERNGLRVCWLLSKQ